MAEDKKIRPSEAIRTLEQYNVNVLLLIHQCDMALKNKLVNDIISSSLQDALNKVKEFHTE